MKVPTAGDYAARQSTPGPAMGPKCYCGGSSAGRASACQAEGRGFDPRPPLHYQILRSRRCIVGAGRGVQPPRELRVCSSALERSHNSGRGRGFKSFHIHQDSGIEMELLRT